MWSSQLAECERGFSRSQTSSFHGHTQRGGCTRSASSLIRPQKTDLGDKPFMCRECGCGSQISTESEVTLGRNIFCAMSVGSPLLQSPPLLHTRGHTMGKSLTCAGNVDMAFDSHQSSLNTAEYTQRRNPLCVKSVDRASA